LNERHATKRWRSRDRPLPPEPRWRSHRRDNCWSGNGTKPIEAISRRGPMRRSRAATPKPRKGCGLGRLLDQEKGLRAGCDRGLVGGVRRPRWLSQGGTDRGQQMRGTLARPPLKHAPPRSPERAAPAFSRLGRVLIELAVPGGCVLRCGNDLTAPADFQHWLLPEPRPRALVRCWVVNAEGHNKSVRQRKRSVLSQQAKLHLTGC